MTDTAYGVYVRIQNTDGALFSTSRGEWAQALEDLEAFGGEEFKNNLVDSLKKGFVVVETNVVQLPTPVVQTEEIDEVAALAAAESMLVSTPTPDVSTAEETRQFEKCEVCGGIKDQWRPGGVSKNGKKYPGFWGCNNFRNHPRN